MGSMEASQPARSAGQTIQVTWIVRALLGAVVALAASQAATAQTDEIQVYDGTLAPRGTFNLTLHNNFTPDGLKDPAFPGAVVSDRSLNGVPEWAYGITEWLEGGLYLPLYSVGRRDGHRDAMLNGAKLRVLVATPNAEKRRFFYDANFEFSYNARHWDPSRFTSELRPIIGWHLGEFELIVNPILDTAYDGVKNIEFAPCARLAYEVSGRTAIAVEEYADLGPLHGFYPTAQQFHQLYGVYDHSFRWANVEAGVGFGLTGGSDRITLKVMLSRDLK
jgi:hypothetical protein